MLHYKLPKLAEAPVLADQIKVTYIEKKKNKGHHVNHARLAYIDLLNVLDIPTDETSIATVSPLHISKTYASEEIYSLATGDMVGSIHAGVMSTDTDDIQEDGTYDEANVLKAGVLIFLEEDISKKEYNGHSSKRRKGYFYTSGSDLSRIIEETLKIDKKNILSDQMRFIYLSSLYHHIKRNVSDGELIHPVWKTRKMLLDDLESVMRQVKLRDDERLKMLTHGAPRLNILQKYIEELDTKYVSACKQRLFTNSNRDNLVGFIKIIKKTCEQDYETTLGLLLFGIMHICAEKKYKLLSPKGGYLNNGSELYKQLLRLLNVDDLNEISYDRRIDWLLALVKHVTEVMRKPELDSKAIANLDYFKAKIVAYANQLEVEKKQPSLTARCVSKSVSMTAQYGIGCVVASQVMPLIGGAVVGAITGPAGVVVYGVAGTMLVAKFSEVLPGPISYAYGFVLEKIGSAIGNSTVAAANYTFSMGKCGLKMLLGHPSLKKEDKEFMQRYIDSILNAPTSVVSEQEKSQLRLVLGIEEDLERSFVMVNNRM